MFKFDEICELIKLVAATGVAAVELDHGGSKLRIDGVPLNPVARATPRAFIETGVTAVDLMNSLVRGQKLPIFSGGGLPHDRIAVEIAANARLRGADASDFAIVFAGC